jgi:signal peptidase I
MTKRYLLHMSLFLINFVCLGWIILSQTEVRENCSESLKGVRYILFRKIPLIERDDLVAIRGHREDHVGELQKLPYTKRVIGLPGDSISNSHGIHINNKSLSLLKHDRYGKPLTPLSLTHVPQGFLFVAGDSHNSFDSRYEEFGLVPFQKIMGKAIFTW